ncbi:hypothetical protein Tco_0027811, partial [Tanacetum coccineum]
VVEVVVEMVVMEFQGLGGTFEILSSKGFKDEVSLIDVVFDGAFGGVRDEEVVVGEGVVRFSSSFVRSTKSCFREGFEEDEDDKKSGNEGLFN